MPFMAFSISLGVCIQLYFLLEETTNLKITPGIIGGDFARPFSIE